MFTVGTGILFGFVWRSCGGVSSACIEASFCLVDRTSWLLRSFGPIWFGTGMILVEWGGGGGWLGM